MIIDLETFRSYLFSQYDEAKAFQREALEGMQRRDEFFTAHADDFQYFSGRVNHALDALQALASFDRGEML